MNEGTPETIAFKLLDVVAKAEGYNLASFNAGIDRKWILQTYAQCLTVVKHGWDADAAMSERPLP